MTDIDAENRRLHILKCLQSTPSYRRSTALLQGMLARIGLSASLSVIDNDVLWLERVDLVITEGLGDYLMVLLRKEGIEVADGVVTMKGIARPLPRS
jgi:hypothetical protein